jgi:microcystin-dependent protein
MEGTIAEIRMFAGNFAPRSWAFCQGQILSIAQNTALFSILGTTYGGNGQTTFALPDFRGRVAVGAGQGPGLQSIALGEQAGVETVTLIAQQMPMHNHTISGNAGGLANNANPTGNSLGIAVVAAGNAPVNVYNNGAPNPANALNAQTCGIAGGNQPHNNMQPFLGMNYIICLEGIFPSRN